MEAPPKWRPKALDWGVSALHARPATAGAASARSTPPPPPCECCAPIGAAVGVVSATFVSVEFCGSFFWWPLNINFFFFGVGLGMVVLGYRFLFRHPFSPTLTHLTTRVHMCNGRCNGHCLCLLAARANNALLTGTPGVGCVKFGNLSVALAREGV